MRLNRFNLAQSAVERLLPPACREHVLGDLEERSRGELARYLADALLTLPMVIWSQTLRAVGARLLIAQAVAAYLSFLFASLLLGGTLAPNLALPALVTAVALALGDTYGTPRNRPPWSQIAFAARALLIGFLANAAMAAFAPDWAAPSRVALLGCGLGVTALAMLRVFLDAGEPRRHPAAGPPSREEIRSRVREIQNEIRFRNLGGIVASIFIPCVFFRIVWQGVTPLQQFGVVLLFCGCGVIQWQMRRYPAGRLPADSSAETILAFYRQQLVRQIEFHSPFAFWSRGGPIFLGALAFYAGAIGRHPQQARALAVNAAAFVVMAILTVPLNYQFAAKYRWRLEELNTRTPAPN